VTRFKDRPEILMWELTNEINLEADLDLTARGGKPGDNFSTDDLIGFVTRFAQEIRNIDSVRPIETGYGSPRACAAHLRRSPEYTGHPDWTNDSDAELRAYVRDTNPDPIDVVSMHPYDDEVNNIAKYQGAAVGIGKPLFCGEFGDTKEVISQNPQAAGKVFLAYLAQFEANGVALASAWDYEFFQFDPSEPDPMSMLAYVNDDLFQALRAQNERSGAVSPASAAATGPHSLISRPADGATLASGTAVSVYVHASDRAAITKVELFVDGASAGSTASYPFTIAWTPTAPGKHTLVARVTNGAGLTTDSKTVHALVASTTTPALLTVSHDIPAGWFQRHSAVDGTLMGYESLFAFDATLGDYSLQAVSVSTDRVFACIYAQNAQGAVVTAKVGDLDAKVTTGPSGYPGYDQVNVELPAALAGRGTVSLVLTVDGMASNAVSIAIK